MEEGGPRKVTQKDIADRTGHSLKTVNLALNNSPRVAPAARKAIEDVAAELGYVLHRERSGRLGLVAGAINHPYYSDVIDAIVQAASLEAGYGIDIRITRGFIGAELQAINELDQLGAEGLLLLSPRLPEARLESLVRRSRPIVVVNADVGARPGLESIKVDNERAARDLTAALIARGHQHFAYLSGPGTQTNFARRRGCELELASQAPPLPGLLVFPGGDDRSGFEAGAKACRHLLEAQLEQFPTAVICYNDRYALGALYELQQAKKRVPNDVSVAGFDGLEFTEYSVPQLSTVELPRAQLGRLAVHKLLVLMGARPPGSDEGELPPLRVQLRGSVDDAAAELWR
jgi:LacI family repressor for deo operon, udp, cdd, tsx, nupC, and nupG